MGWRDLFLGKTAPKDEIESLDQMTLAQLRKAGADLSQPREVIHYLYVPSRAAGQVAAAALRAQGYTVEEKPSADAQNNPPNPWLVLAVNHTVVHSESIAMTRRRFEELAAAAGGEYDGWEAAAKP